MGGLEKCNQIYQIVCSLYYISDISLTPNKTGFILEAIYQKKPFFVSESPRLIQMQDYFTLK